MTSACLSGLSVLLCFNMLKCICLIPPKQCATLWHTICGLCLSKWLWYPSSFFRMLFYVFTCFFMLSYASKRFQMLLYAFKLCGAKNFSESLINLLLQNDSITKSSHELSNNNKRKLFRRGFLNQTNSFKRFNTLSYAFNMLLYAFIMLYIAFIRFHMLLNAFIRF